MSVFLVMQRDPTTRECPRCGSLCRHHCYDTASDLEVGVKQQDAEMTCGSCGKQFCYFHSNAHEGQTCEEYEKQIRKQEECTALKNTKPCPNCGIKTEKNGGCNHMTCARCGKHWCWICNGDFPRCGCHEAPGRAVMHRCRDNPCFWLFASIGVVIVGLPCATVALIFAVVELICLLTFLVYLPVAAVLVGPCARFDPFVIAATAAALASLPLAALQLMWMTTVGPVVLMLCCCGAGDMASVLLYGPLLAPALLFSFTCTSWLTHDDDD